MKSHYNKLFSDKGAKSVMRILGNESMQFEYEPIEKVLFFPRHGFKALLESYSCSAKIEFEDIRFSETTDVKLCGMDAL